MKKINFAIKSVIVLLIYFVCYNTYFGWNKTPQSDIEKTFDYIFSVGMNISCFIYLMPIFSIYEKWVEKSENSDN